MRKVVICACPSLAVGAGGRCEFVCFLFSAMCYVLILCVFSGRCERGTVKGWCAINDGSRGGVAWMLLKSLRCLLSRKLSTKDVAEHDYWYVLLIFMHYLHIRILIIA